MGKCKLFTSKLEWAYKKIYYMSCTHVLFKNCLF